MTDSLVDDVEEDRPQDGQDDELTLNLPAWLTEGVERRRAAWTRVDAAALVAVAVHLALTGIVISRGSYYLDDLRAQASTLNRSLTDFLVHPQAAPFAPVPGLLTWLIADRFTLEHGPAVLATVAVRAVLAVALWRLLRRLSGPRPILLLPLGLLLVTPALLPSTTWFQASITVLAATAFTVWALDAFVAWEQEGQRRSLITLAAVTLLACGCHLLGACIPVLLLVLRLTLLDDRRAPLRRAVAGIAIAAASALAYLAGYLTLSGAPVAGLDGGSPVDAFRVASAAVLRQVLPGLLGGPLTWSYPRPYVGTSDPGTLMVIFSTVAALVGLGYVGFRTPGRAARVVAFLIGALVPPALVAAVARTDAVGPLLTPAETVAGVLVPLVLVAAAYAAAGPARTLPVSIEASTEAMAGPTRGRRRAAGDGPLEIGTLGLTAGLVVAAVVVCSLISAGTYTRTWWDNPTGNWLTQVRSQMNGAEAYPRIVATPLPPTLVPPSEARIFPSSAPLLQLLRPDARFHDADGQFRALNAAGLLLHPYVATLGRSRKAPFCIATIAEGSRSSRWIALTKDVPYVPGAQVAVGLLAGASGRVEVSMRTPEGTTIKPIRYSDDELPTGPHQINVPVPYGRAISAVKVSIERPARTCISVVSVWAPYL